MADLTVQERYQFARLNDDSATLADLAERLMNELQALAVYAAGYLEPGWTEPEYPSGADMVDRVNEMIERLGMTHTPVAPAPEPSLDEQVAAWAAERAAITAAATDGDDVEDEAFENDNAAVELLLAISERDA